MSWLRLCFGQLGSDDSETDEEDIDLDMSKDLVDAAAGVTALTE